MAPIYPNYPGGCSDKKIKEAIQGYSDDIYSARGNINTVMSLSPLLQMGLSELNGRQNKRIACLSLVIGIISLGVAGVALFISININNDSTNKQLESLNKI